MRWLLKSWPEEITKGYDPKAIIWANETLHLYELGLPELAKGNRQVWQRKKGFFHQLARPSNLIESYFYWPCHDERVAFDGFVQKECVLKESKASYDQFFDSNGGVKFFMTLKNFGEGLFIKQAKSQCTCAIKGMPPGRLEWYFMQPISAKYARIEFASEGLNINVICKPMPLDNI